MRFLPIVCLALAALYANVDALKSIHRGRPLGKHGMLGLPGGDLVAGSLGDPPLPSPNWFDQKLDHFDPSNTKRWKQRYFYTLENFNAKDNGPVFLQLGGEGEASPVWLTKGQIAENYAPSFGAASILLEHRYYGASHPTEDMSVENLRYLSSEQSLQDAAVFIEWFKKKHNLVNNKWIVFGGSYSGGLAAWMRLKYPHLVAGAVASSAPVNAILDFDQYLKVVDTSLGADCTQNIRDAMVQVERLLEHPMGWRTITSMFKTCDDFNSTLPLDVSNFIQDLAGNFEGVVQYNKDNRKFEGAGVGNITIDVVCEAMADETQLPINRMANVNSMILESSKQKCLDFKYENFINQLRETSWNKTVDSGARLWTYQTCTEFGYFQSSDAPDQPFGSYFDADFFVQQCIDIYGPKFNREFIEQSIAETNSMYGSTNLQVTNVVFPNGLIDPWHSLGILKQINPSSRPVIIPETAHCADLYPSDESDPSSLKRARKTISASIQQFLV